MFLTLIITAVLSVVTFYVASAINHNHSSQNDFSLGGTFGSMLGAMVLPALTLFFGGYILPAAHLPLVFVVLIVAALIGVVSGLMSGQDDKDSGNKK